MHSSPARSAIVRATLRTREAIAVPRDLLWRAPALAHGVAEKSARTRIHRADQHEARGEDRRPGGSRDRDVPFLERLSQDFEDVAAEFEHLVQKQHAVM